MSQSRFNIQYELPVGGSLDWLRVRIRTHRGQVEAFMVQYETVISGRIYPVVRYDCAHGFAHRDILNHRGDVIDKQPLREQTDLNQALQEAIAEVKAERRLFRAAFIRRIPWKLLP